MGCQACAPGATTDPTRVVHDDVPLHTQFMSHDLIDAIVYGGADAAGDPLWHTSGARDRGEYGRWCGHACGMACLQMVLHHLRGHTPPLLDLLRGCRDYGGYVEHADGHIKGLIYAPFTGYVRAEHGLQADVHRHLAVTDIPRLLAEGHLVLASVHREIRRPDLPAPGRGGHLVLVTGHDNGTLHFANPSGHTPGSRRTALPIDLFDTFFGRRGITISSR
ncbi:C39 family peptidase [Sinosporangium siamense]|uniref:Peptidase C39-like domain-containing protein n=1 Tax=Sinosporangium siamense TaxID=1367973 RepID=A0A919VFG8_9ACTN|nr:C39 family peptidase [Sinosporangium siamense]GII96109.1 hypothetical protein Ssi02_63400 [Sinosporangium siamense]